MKKKLTSFILIISMVITLSFPTLALANTSPTTIRLAGSDRYETAVAIAKEGWIQSDYAVLVCGNNYPDALVATPVAKKYNAPILLSYKDSLPSATKQELTDLKVKNVILIGGTGVLSVNLHSELQNMGITPSQWAGEDRYETSLVVAFQFSDVSQVAITTGEDFADALSIAPIAANKNMPIILVPKDDISDYARAFIKQHNLSKTYIVGNTDQISDNDANQFPNVERITGSTKYERNIAVFNKFSSDLSGNNVYVATGNDFADALAGTALAAKNNAPIVLVDNTISNNTQSYLDKVLPNKQLNILGGIGVVSDSLFPNYIATAPTLTNPASTNKTLTPSEISKSVSTSVVYIEVYDSSGKAYGSGSGFFVDNNGKIVTNYHVIENASSAKVQLSDGRIFDVNKVYAYDKNRDVAVLGINATGLSAVNLGDSSTINTGDKIYAIGSPKGLENTISDGLISSKSRTINGQIYIQVSAPISPGSSGGVLVDEQARVIGVTSATLKDSQNLNFAIPINDVKGYLSMNISKTLADLNGGILTSPVATYPSPTPSNPSNTNTMTDSEFASYLNSNYSVLTVNGKSVHFNWKVNDYALSDVNVHTTINSTDFVNWLDILLANHQSDVFTFFNKISVDIMKNYPGKTFWGNVQYQDYYSFYPSSFKPSEISLSPDYRWLVTHAVVSFFDFRFGGVSDPKVEIK